MNDLSVIEKEFGDLGKFRKCPPFWTCVPELGMPVIEGLKQAEVKTIGKSVSGRDIIAVEYGEKEPLGDTTNNIHSAMASKIVPPDPTEIFPQAFFGSKRRKKPVLVLQGGIHGGELTGTVASINLCKVIEDGVDLRGKAWPKLQQLARDSRILIIPWLNPDATARWPVWNPVEAPGKLQTRCTQGVASDGTKYSYPAVKAIFPIPPDKTAFMGSYYNDNGVNLQYDFMEIDRQPETIAWMKYYLDEKPDGALIFHCDGGSIISNTSYHMPVGYQFEMHRLGGAVRSRLLHEGLEVGRLSWAGLPNFCKPYVDQINAVYLLCGAMAILCELPGGGIEYKYTLDDMLDIGLLVIEETLFYAHRDGLRPYELWDKVKKQLQ